MKNNGNQRKLKQKEASGNVAHKYFMTGTEIIACTQALDKYLCPFPICSLTVCSAIEQSKNILFGHRSIFLNVLLLPLPLQVFASCVI